MREGPMLGDSRQKIISATIELIAQEGYQSVSLADIAKLCRLNKATFYHHFAKGKTELMAEATKASMDTCQREIFQELECLTTPHARAEHLANSLDFFFNDKALPQFLTQLLVNFTSLEPEAKAQVDSYLTKWQMAIASVVDDSWSIDIHAMTTLSLAYLHGLIILRKTMDSAIDVEAIQIQLLQLWGYNR